MRDGNLHWSGDEESVTGCDQLVAMPLVEA